MIIHLASSSSWCW